ncbi:MAG: polymer-forming cytoskeletal protein, partial [Verrucomicrobia bacterium]|nr:polymer-forming cytoskeletal protein [Verrucomicrobiota bacterium]
PVESVASQPSSRLFPFHFKDSPLIQPGSMIHRYLSSSPENRTVMCTECGKEHSASSQAQASHCPSCGVYVSLRNYEINENWHRRIQTRGNIHILKKGSVQGVLLQCHHLTIDGTFRGSAQCSGKISINRSTTILGRISCQHLHIPSASRVESHHPIETHSALIEGELIGSIVAKGSVKLRKKAFVKGDITAGSIAISPGARQQGLIAIQQSRQ